MTILPVKYPTGITLLEVVAPEFCSWNAEHTIMTADFTKPSVTAIIPNELIIKLMPSLMADVISAPALTLGTMYINPNIPTLPMETLVHECVHYFQRKRMGAISYDSTFLWHIMLNFVKSGTHWHDTHEMEVEARWIARRVIAECYVAGKSLNVEMSIKQIAGW